jgi:capsular polysaccharide biosynthesis protein
MENLQYSKIFRKNWEIVALIIGVTVVLALIISLLQPFQYSATTKLLVIQRQDKNLDAYTANKSAERIGKNLASVISTSSFYNEVIESNNTISNKFSTDSYERRKQWNKNVKANVITETGIIEIKTFAVERPEASQLANTISHVLITKGGEYHGGGSDVELKIVDDVFISKYPVRPNIILNSILAVIVGFLFGSAALVLSEAKKKNETQNVEQATIFDTQPEQVLAAETNETDEDYIELDPDETEVIPQLGEEVMENDEVRKNELKTMYDHLA